MSFTIFHNPRCGTSRQVLQALQDAGVQPVVVEYLKQPPPEPLLRELLAEMGLPPSGLLRRKEALCSELGLDRPDTREDQVLAALLAHPVLINRPIVRAPRGTRLCRPATEVQALLPADRG